MDLWYNCVLFSPCYVHHMQDCATSSGERNNMFYLSKSTDTTMYKYSITCTYHLFKFIVFKWQYRSIIIKMYLKHQRSCNVNYTFLFFTLLVY